MRKFLSTLDRRGDVVHVDKQVQGRHEVAAVTYRVQRESDSVVLFHDVAGTRFPVVSNIYGSRGRLCELVGANAGNFCARWNQLMQSSRLVAGDAIERVAGEDIQDARMSDLPQITYCEQDVGPYITAGVFLANDPDTGVPNLSFHRTMLVSDTEVRCRLGPPHDLTHYQKVAEERGQALDVAILVGAPPEIFLGACASIPRTDSEIDVAACIRGGPIPMRPCKTIDMMVPAETEIVIEGRILPNVRRPEGPFGEFLWQYTPEGMNHVVEVLNVSHREDAIFHSLLCGSPEDLMALDVAFASRVYANLVKDIPGIVDVTCQPTLNTTVVKIRKQYEGHAQHVFLKAFAAHLQYNKVCIVVDEDVDIHDFEQVWWAVMTRAQLDTGVFQWKGIPGFYHDHGIKGLHAGRLGIDATVPTGGKNFARKRIPGFDELRLADYVRRSP
jgi:UbiD family decarboxylase